MQDVLKREFSNKMKTQHLLNVETVSMSFGGIQALNNVSMAVGKGEIRGVIGPNGSGKSTLLNLISGVYRPQRGSIFLSETDLVEVPPHKVAAHGVARTFQNLELFSGMTVLENIVVGLHTKTHVGFPATLWNPSRLKSMDGKACEKAMETLAFVKMDMFAERLVTELSIGQQRLVEIVRAIVSEPLVLLLDEPAAGLSLTSLDMIKDLISSLPVKRNITVVIVEHVLNVVMDLSDKITVLHHGEVIADGSPDEIRANHDVIEAYLGTAEI